MDVISASLVGDNHVAWYENLTILGVDENKSRDIQLYPNPAQDFLTINNTNSKIQTIKMYDAFGKLLLSTLNYNKEDIILNVQNLSKGVYFIKLEDILGQQTVKKFVKN